MQLKCRENKQIT
jgi:hypothetical protein